IVRDPQDAKRAAEPQLAAARLDDARDAVQVVLGHEDATELAALEEVQAVGAADPHAIVPREDRGHVANAHAIVAQERLHLIAAEPYQFRVRKSEPDVLRAVERRN